MKGKSVFILMLHLLQSDLTLGCFWVKLVTPFPTPPYWGANPGLLSYTLNSLALYHRPSALCFKTIFYKTRGRLAKHGDTAVSRSTREAEAEGLREFASLVYTVSPAQPHGDTWSNNSKNWRRPTFRRELNNSLRFLAWGHLFFKG